VPSPSLLYCVVMLSNTIHCTVLLQRNVSNISIFFCKIYGISIQDCRSVWSHFMGMLAEGITSNMLTSMLNTSHYD
jgi:hypothetical protein